MEFSIKSGKSEKQRNDCVIVGVYESGKLSHSAKSIDDSSEGFLAKVLKRGDMDGKLGSTLLLQAVVGANAERVLLVGLGKQGELDKDAPSDLPQIQNDGILHEVGVLGVPNAHTLPHHFRWIDNAGALLCDSVRFGGEATGMIPLVVKPVKGTRSLSVIQNSWLVLSSDTKAHPEDPTTSALVECEGMPDLLCLRNNVGLEESESRPKLALTGPTVQLLPDISLEAIKEHLFFSGNMIPETTGTLKKSVAE